MSSPPNEQGCGEAVEALSGERTKYHSGFEKAIVMINCDLNNKRQKGSRRGQMCFTNTRSGDKIQKIKTDEGQRRISCSWHNGICKTEVRQEGVSRHRSKEAMASSAPEAKPGESAGKDSVSYISYF